MSNDWKDDWREEKDRLRQIRRDVRQRFREKRREERGNRRPFSFPSAGSASVHLIVGLLVVMLGGLFLVSNLNIFELRSPMRYFGSLVLLAIGFGLVIEHRSERMWQWGIGWILLGVWSFGYRSGWITIDIWALFFPLLLLGVGGYLVRRALLDDGGKEGPESPPASGPDGSPAPTSGPGTSSPFRESPFKGEKTIRGIGVLSGSELRPSTQAMERAELFALMGGVKLDLYDAQLINDAATINVGAIMGGIEILVPSEWTVISNVLPLMGAFIDKRRPAATTPSTTSKKTLTINGFVLMGGVEIKN